MKSIVLSCIIFLLVSNHLIRAEAIAVLAGAYGDVLIKRMGSSTYTERASLGISLDNGDAIKVGSLSYASVMYLSDKSVVKMRENSQLQLMDTPNTRTVELDFGTVLTNVMKEGRRKTFRMQTPSSVVTVTGTEFASIIDPINGVDQFIGKTGNFNVMNIASGQTIPVGPGQKAVSNAIGNLMQAPSTKGEYPVDPEQTPYQQGPKPSERAKQIMTNQSISETFPDESIKDSSINDNEENSSQPKKEVSDSVKDISDNPKDDAPQTNNLSNSKKPFGMGLGIGSASLDGVIYNQISLRPEINFGKLGVGFDLVFYIDNDGNFRQEEWDFDADPSIFFDKILFVSYGEKVDPLWVKYGSLDGITLGYGGLVSNYSNMMEFPSVRRAGVNTGFNIGPVNAELFLANIKDLSRGGTLFGLRGQYTISESIPLSIGFNIVKDANMFSGLKDKDGDTYPDIFDDFPNDSTLWNDSDGDGFPDPGQGASVPDSLIDIDADGDNIIDQNENQSDIVLKALPFSLQGNDASASGFTLDIGYPVLSGGAINIDIFAEYNKLDFPSSISADSVSFIREKRSGTSLSLPGVRSTIFRIFDVSIEYRMISGSYVPQFFDKSYDLNRVVTQSADAVTSIKTKDMLVFPDSSNQKNSKGLFGSASLDFFNLASFSASYANMSMDTTSLKTFSALLTLNAENIPKISSAMAYYQRNNDENPFDWENPTVNTILGYRIGYELSKGVSLIWDYRQFYRDAGIGKLEPIKQTTIETTFNF